MEYTNIFSSRNEKSNKVDSNITIVSTALNVAAYIMYLYETTYHERIDEMKLHKLLYFVQREALASVRTIAFEDEFRAWKFGPVILCVREAYRENTFPDVSQISFNQTLTDIIDKVFKTYSSRSSWSLSDITHCEISWRNARKGIPDGENGNNRMLLADIEKDADRLRCARAEDVLRRFISDST